MRKALIVIGAAAVLAAGCGGGDAADVVEIRGQEYTYSLPEQVEGGWRTIRFTNDGEEEHDAIILRLDRGRTVGELQEYMKSPKAAEGPPPWVTLQASVGAIAKDEAVAVTQRLAPGHYVVACSVAGPDGVPHFNRGMLKAFEIVGRGEGGPPKADGVIVLGSRIQPPRIEPGEQTIELRNEGASDGGALVYALEPGTTVAELKQWIGRGTEPAPAHYVMGDLIAANMAAFYTTEFEAGRKYAILNEANGEVTLFTVS